MTIRLREFHDSDGPALLAIHTAAILATGDQFYSPAERGSWAHGLTSTGYARSRDGGETFLIATGADDVAVGFCSWSRQQIVGLYVAPQWQGNGIGSRLLTQGEDALRACGVALSRIHASLSAVGFYEAHGYVVTTTSTHASRGGLAMADAWLEKPLNRE